MMQEIDMEGFSSSIKWKCCVCGMESICSTSSKIKFTNIKGEKPKAAINIQAVGGIMTNGATFKTLEGLMGLIDIPCMTHQTFNKAAKFFGETSANLAVNVLENNAKLEGQLAKQNEATEDALGRIPISVSYDGNWAKHSYKHSYNSLLGGGWMFGFHSQ